MNAPAALFHYTSLSSFALILKNRTIRFTRLDKLDDPQESRTADSRNLAKTRFASCWTACSNESIPMWREYAGVECGVRVELPVDPFKRYCWDVDEIERVTRLPCEDMNGGETPFNASLVPFEALWDKGLYVMEAAGKNDILKEVEYTDDHGLLFPEIIKWHEDGSLTAQVGDLGARKATAWSYQAEWRYLLTIMPFDMKGSWFDQEAAFSRLGAFVSDRADVETPVWYDLELSDEAFSRMRVTVSPGMSAGNRVIMDALLGRYNPAALVIPSSIEL